MHAGFGREFNYSISHAGSIYFWQYLIGVAVFWHNFWGRGGIGLENLRYPYLCLPNPTLQVHRQRECSGIYIYIYIYRLKNDCRPFIALPLRHLEKKHDTRTLLDLAN